MRRIQCLELVNIVHDLNRFLWKENNDLEKMNEIVLLLRQPNLWKPQSIFQNILEARRLSCMEFLIKMVGFLKSL